VILKSVFTLNVILLSVIIPNVVLQNVVRLIVVALRIRFVSVTELIFQIVLFF